MNTVMNTSMGRLQMWVDHMVGMHRSGREHEMGTHMGREITWA